MSSGVSYRGAGKKTTLLVVLKAMPHLSYDPSVWDGITKGIYFER